MRFGMWEIVLVVLFILIFFGAKRIPELMRGLGSGIKEFKSGLKEEEQNDKGDKKEEGK